MAAEVLDEVCALVQRVAHRQRGNTDQVQAVGIFLEEVLAELMAFRRGEPFPEPPPPDPDRPCLHPDLEIGVSIQRIMGEGLLPIGYWAEVIVACKVCDEAFRWTGAKPGLSPAEPRTSVDQRTLIAPFRPATADPDFGMGIPGFDVNLIGPEAPHAMTAAAVREQALLDAADLVRRRVTPTMSIAARRELRNAVAAIERVVRKETSA
jgi:hypothetical protein